MKRFGVRFYQANVLDAPDGIPALAQLLDDEYQRSTSGTGASQLHDNPFIYELRELASINRGSVWRGVLAVLRDDAPHIRAADGTERAIQLGDDERIIEKNYFLFFRARNLLIWQVNGRASHVMRMERYMTMLTGERCTVTFDDILDRRALDRLNAGTVKRLRVRLAAVRNAEHVRADDWSDTLFETMATSQATSLELEIGTRRKGHGLTDGVKHTIHSLMNRAEIRAVDVKLVGENDFIDLLADCVKDNIEVHMIGRYPDADHIFRELGAAHDRRRAQLDDFFGAGNRVLE